MPSYHRATAASVCVLLADGHTQGGPKRAKGSDARRRSTPKWGPCRPGIHQERYSTHRITQCRTQRTIHPVSSETHRADAFLTDPHTNLWGEKKEIKLVSLRLGSGALVGIFKGKKDFLKILFEKVKFTKAIEYIIRIYCIKAQGLIFKY